MAEPLHARTALAIVRTAQAFAGAVALSWGGHVADAHSLTALLALMVPAGARVDITVRGCGAEAVTRALAALLTAPDGARLQPVAVLAPGSAAAPACTAGELPSVGVGRCIVVADEVSAEQLLLWPRELLAGVVVGRGGPTSHAAIVARELGVPMVAGLPEATLRGIVSGQWVAIDGARALVDLQADASSDPGDKAAPIVAARTLLRPSGPAGPELLAEADSAEAVRSAMAIGADGIGLVRTELHLLTAEAPGGAADLLARYAAILDAADGAPVRFRLYDLAQDKLPAYLRRDLPPASVGLSGAGLVLLLPELLVPQLEALAGLAAQRPLRVLCPFLRTPQEWRALAQLWEGVGGAPALLDPMIETAAAALGVEDYGAGAANISIGTNDLLAGVFGHSRDSAWPAPERLLLEPAWLRLLQRVIAAVHLNGGRVTVCGVMASSPAGALLAAGMGVDALTLPTSALLRTRALLSATDADALGALACNCCAAGSSEQVRALVAAASRSAAESLEKGLT
ncbi:MAG: hypothetical protein GX557_03055 [Chloroflexi bacterium]|nr:hypothetical protein [Chloroflexota bacterium]